MNANEFEVEAYFVSLVVGVNFNSFFFDRPWSIYKVYLEIVQEVQLFQMLQILCFLIILEGL